MNEMNFKNRGEQVFETLKKRNFRSETGAGAYDQ